MRNLFNFLKKDRIWDFDGGIHPPEMKTQSNGTPLCQIPLPSQFIIPLKQHIGSEGELCVAPGDKVLRGQPLTFGRGRMLPVHAPTSGTVERIAPHITAHPSGLAEMCVFIIPDGEDRWIERETVSDYRQLTREDVVNRIHQAGVAGLGGAGFPTGTKLRGGLQGVNTLIINAAECEPYITADDRLMQDCAAEVLEGSRILAWVLQAERVLIGIEDNKPEAIAALKQALGDSRDLQLRVIPTKYPSGGAKQLTKILTGKEVPHGGRSSDIGVLMQNVGTAFAVKRAIVDGEPITERVVTLTGESVARPCNVWGRLGTPVSHLLRYAGFAPTAAQMVVMGGPLMGFTLPSLDVPVVKISNCILAPSASEMGNNEPEQSCIRCSACADACPASLLPQQLYWYSQGGDHEKARAHFIDDCIECGACAYVCPSNIPLVQYYRQEKAELRAIDQEAKRTAEAKARFEARKERLEREKLAREQRHEQAKRRVSASDQSEISAALARVKAKQTTVVDESALATAAAEREARKAEAHARQAEEQAATAPASNQTDDPRKAAVEAAIARAKAKKAAQDTPALTAEKPADASEESDPRKAAVAAAIARAKAKKAAQSVEAAPPEPPATCSEENTPPVSEEADPRKAAVAAAIARAKAKKAAQAAEAAQSEPPSASSEESAPPVSEETDPRKAALAAAIARAKAKKAAQAAEAAQSEPPATSSEGSTPPVSEEADPRKAAVAAAIARAKAKNAAQAAEAAQSETHAASSEESTPPVSEETDPRKAAVAAAIARAKAKKAAQAAEAAQSEPPAAQEANTDSNSETDDPRKAAVAAAIARVKARKAAQQHSVQEE
ncbi:electron transport complex subunit RsxC [Erwinia sp. V71]|uniref:electron transport complex subunit RsxC n=1 Tax=Erwinia sp. V71 TaxID=3369424 RepID=UPI003F6199D8